jgi:hypothetical protein
MRNIGYAITSQVGEAQVMLQVAPTHWFSSDFTVRQASRRVVDADVSCWCEKAVLTIEGVRYEVYREGWMSRAFVLEQNAAIIARAEKPSAFFRRYLLRYADRTYTLEAASSFRRKFILLDGSQQIGSIAPISAFTREAAADLPDTLPLHLRAFIIWLAMMQWRRDRNG